MVSDVYMICDAYESGVGKGRSGQAVKNPYAKNGDIDAKCHEAWQIGYEFGAESADDEDHGWYARYREHAEYLQMHSAPRVVGEAA